MKFAASLLSLFQISPRPGVVEWTEGNIVIPRKMSPVGAGRFSTENKPFMRWMLECWNPANGVNLCAVAGSAQLFKSTVLALGIAYRIRWEPVPILIVGPSEKWSKREISERRLHPLIDENPALASEKPADLDKFKLLHMAMRGGDIVVTGANSDTDLAGGTFGVAAVDEAAKIVQENREEAPESHPILLTFERTNAYGPSAFKFLSSTPNSPDHLFWQYVEKGDFTHPAVMCPHCKQWFNLEIEEDKKRDYMSLRCARDARDADGLWDREKVVATARYICPINGCEIGSEHKRKMLREMEPDRKNGRAPKNERSFRVNFLHDPNLSFGDALYQFLQAQGDLFGLQNFRNSKLALTWEEMDCNLKDEQVNARKVGIYRQGTVPFKPVGLIATADPGERETHWTVYAVMLNGDLYAVDWGTVLHWSELLRPDWVGRRRYAVAGTETYVSPMIGFIDSGDWTHQVYQFCRASRSTGILWFPTKGSNAEQGTWAESSPPEDDSLKLYTYVDKTAKTELYLNKIAMGGSPALFFPADADSAFIGGHSGQQLIKTAGKRYWKRLPWDHYGDCTKLAMVGSWVLEGLLADVRRKGG